MASSTIAATAVSIRVCLLGICINELLSRRLKCRNHILFRQGAANDQGRQKRCDQHHERPHGISSRMHHQGDAVQVGLHAPGQQPGKADAQTKAPGKAITVSNNNSPNKIKVTSARVKPNTRKLASSRPRSASAMRALLYTTAKAIKPAITMLNSVNITTVSSMVSLKAAITLSRKFTPAMRGIRSRRRLS